MNRAEAIARFSAGGTWDIAIVGGGATGLASAFDAASRGYKVALIERDDFAQGTSSRSTKLVHGGVRYLRQGRIGLVRSALRERTRLLHNAPGQVHTRHFIIPVYSGVEKAYYGLGLKLYDLLARGSAEPSQMLSRRETLAALPGLRDDRLAGGVRYTDGQFDDAALAVALAFSAWQHGATVANYVSAAGLIKRGGKIRGVEARDAETGATFSIEARVVINATGVFTDALRQLDDGGSAPIVVPSQGSHVVLPRRFLPGEAAILVPKTADGRVLFAIPWLDRVLVGTTDTPLQEIPREPRPLPAEIDFLLEHAAIYLKEPPRRADVLSAFAGIRPLVKPAAGSAKAGTSALSRDHLILVSNSGLVSITGGKWTTCRQMAEDVVTRAASVSGLPTRPCRTGSLALEDFPSPKTDLAAAIDATMARTVEDVLARRTRALYLDARASAAAAPEIAALLARLHSRDDIWQRSQVEMFTLLARSHCLAP